MYHLDWFKLRYQLILDYPNRTIDVGDILEAYKTDLGNVLYNSSTINPDDYPTHFRKLRWWEHRTIEQLLTIKYVKVVSNGQYWIAGDIVHVTGISYNNEDLVGGMNSLLFDLSNHYFIPSQIEPATKEEYEKFKSK